MVGIKSPIYSITRELTDWVQPNITIWSNWRWHIKLLRLKRFILRGYTTQHISSNITHLSLTLTSFISISYPQQYNTTQYYCPKCLLNILHCMSHSQAHSCWTPCWTSPCSLWLTGSYHQRRRGAEPATSSLPPDANSSAALPPQQQQQQIKDGMIQ